MRRIGKYLIKIGALKEQAIVSANSLMANVILTGGYVLTALYSHLQLRIDKQNARKFFREGQLYRVRPNPLWVDVWGKSENYPRRAGNVTTKLNGTFLERIPPGTIFMVLDFQSMANKDEIKILLGERVGWIDLSPQEALTPWERFELCGAETLRQVATLENSEEGAAKDE